MKFNIILDVNISPTRLGEYARYSPLYILTLLIPLCKSYKKLYICIGNYFLSLKEYATPNCGILSVVYKYEFNKDFQLLYTFNKLETGLNDFSFNTKLYRSLLKKYYDEPEQSVLMKFPLIKLKETELNEI